MPKYGLTTLSAIVILVCVGVGALLAVVITSPNTSTATARAGLILPILGPALAALIAVYRSEKTGKSVDVLRQHVSEVRDGVADVKEQTNGRLKALEDRTTALEGPNGAGSTAS